MKNTSLHAPLNNTNRNWERALIKKANSGGSSLEKGAYAFTFYSVPEEAIAQFPNPPELIATDTLEYSLYHLEKTTTIEGIPYTAEGLVVLHNYNDLTLDININSSTVSDIKFASIIGGDGLTLLDVEFTKGGTHWNLYDDEITVPFVYIQNDALNDTLYDAISAFLDHEFPLRS